MNLSEIFARNVNERRKVLELSKTDLAAKTTISRNTVTSLTSGKARMIRFESIEEIAKALKCEPQQLFDEKTNWAIFEWANKYRGGHDND